MPAWCPDMVTPNCIITRPLCTQGLAGLFTSTIIAGWHHQCAALLETGGAGCYMLYCYTTDVIIVIIPRVTTGVTSTHWLGDMMECVRVVMGALITWHYSPGHLVSSWSQHPPRNIIMPSLPYQHTTSHKLCKETRASKNSARMLSKYETFRT